MRRTKRLPENIPIAVADFYDNNTSLISSHLAKERFQC
jgi:hypothetical protein